jgi:hypothetical protein
VAKRPGPPLQVGPKVPSCCTACMTCAWAGPSWPNCRPARCCRPPASAATPARATGARHHGLGALPAPWHPPRPAPCHRMRPSPAWPWPAGEGDVLHIPLPAGVPYAVHSVADAGATCLEVDLYGAHHATTWITHRASTRGARSHGRTGRPGRVRLRVAAAQAPRLWGWRVERTAAGAAHHAAARTGGGRRLARWPACAWRWSPATAAPPTWARWAPPACPKRTSTAGRPMRCRPNCWRRRAGGDGARRRRQPLAARARAPRAGFRGAAFRQRARQRHRHQRRLPARGRHVHVLQTRHGARLAAAAVQRRLLEQTGLDDFGLVGNFNYTPIRLVTWMPAVLVEQAFLSHPGDEARLLDPLPRHHRTCRAPGPGRLPACAEAGQPALTPMRTAFALMHPMR